MELMSLPWDTHHQNIHYTQLGSFTSSHHSHQPCFVDANSLSSHSMELAEEELLEEYLLVQQVSLHRVGEGEVDPRLRGIVLIDDGPYVPVPLVLHGALLLAREENASGGGVSRGAFYHCDSHQAVPYPWNRGEGMFYFTSSLRDRLLRGCHSTECWKLGFS